MNNFTAIVNLCRDPEDLELGGRPVKKLRCADSTFGRNAETLFFDAILGGPDVEVASKLRQGDQVVLSGTLKLTTYQAKKGAKKGQAVDSFQMPFAKLLQVTRSPTFFSGTPDTEELQPPEEAEAEAVGTEIF